MSRQSTGKKGRVVLSVRVQPRASRNEVLQCGDGSLKVRVTAPAEGGRANRMLLEVLAEHFGVRRSCVRIISGETSRNKKIEIDEGR